jgi:hypothetical protein
VIRTLFAIFVVINVGSVSAIGPTEKKMEGEIENHVIYMPEGKSFSEARILWFEDASKICGDKDFKVMQYIERTTSYGDAFSLNPATGEYEPDEMSPSIYGMFLCIKNS